MRFSIKAYPLQNDSQYIERLCGRFFTVEDCMSQVIVINLSLPYLYPKRCEGDEYKQVYIYRQRLNINGKVPNAPTRIP